MKQDADTRGKKLKADTINAQLEELTDFVRAMDEKINIAGTRPGKECFVQTLTRIKYDIQLWVDRYQKSLASFNEAYEEVTSLYVFTEIYLTLD